MPHVLNENSTRENELVCETLWHACHFGPPVFNSLHLSWCDACICMTISILAHRGRMMYICVSILSHTWFRYWVGAWSVPGHYLISNARLLLIEHLGTNFSGIWIKLGRCLLTKMYLKLLAAKWRPFGPSLQVLIKLIQCHPEGVNKGAHVTHVLECITEVQVAGQ